MLSACQVFSWKIFNFFRVDNILIVLYQFGWMYQIGTHTHRTKTQCAKRYALRAAAYNWIYLPCIDNLPMRTDLKNVDSSTFSQEHTTVHTKHLPPRVPFFLFYKLTYTPPNAFFRYKTSWYNLSERNRESYIPFEALAINSTLVDMKINNTTIGMSPKTCSTVVLCRTE